MNTLIAQVASQQQEPLNNTSLEREMERMMQDLSYKNKVGLAQTPFFWKKKRREAKKGF